MHTSVLRVGIIGLGANTRLRHVPGLRACSEVEITAVCNRSPESTAAVAREFSIPNTYGRWQDLVADPRIDAVVIGAWPNLHASATLAALEAGKHVLTEARMARNLAEARQMQEASQRHASLVTQIVPSPLGMRAHDVVKQLIHDDYLGELREIVVLGTSDHLADPSIPRHWRQVRELSGLNMLSLGILHETLIRWVPSPTKVMSQCQIFTQQRRDATDGGLQPVETPDAVRVLGELRGGACSLYHLSGVTRFGPGSQIQLYGSHGTLKYLLHPEDRLLGARVGDAGLAEIPIPPERARGWRVEEEFVQAIRGQGQVEFTNFATGVEYMQFTEAVARSAQAGTSVALPL